MKYLFLAMLLVLAGCTAPKEVIVTKTVTNYAVLDDTWLQDCPTVPPPVPLVYKAATLKQRTDMWAATYVEQAKLNAQCRIRTKNARDYNALKRTQSSVLTCTEGQCK